jgi:hypothetical protein
MDRADAALDPTNGSSYYGQLGKLPTDAALKSLYAADVRKDEAEALAALWPRKSNPAPHQRNQFSEGPLFRNRIPHI